MRRSSSDEPPSTQVTLSLSLLAARMKFFNLGHMSRNLSLLASRPNSALHEETIALPLSLIQVGSAPGIPCTRGYLSLNRCYSPLTSIATLSETCLIDY